VEWVLTPRADILVRRGEDTDVHRGERQVTTETEVRAMCLQACVRSSFIIKK
jgi:hypothetical protein